MYSYKNVEIFRIWLTDYETVRHPKSMENYCLTWTLDCLIIKKNTMPIEKNISVLVYSMVRIKVLKLPVSNKIKNHVTFMVVLKNFAEIVDIWVFTDELFNVFYRWIQCFLQMNSMFFLQMNSMFFTNKFTVFLQMTSMFFYRWIQWVFYRWIQWVFYRWFHFFFTDEFNAVFYRWIHWLSVH